VKLLPPTWQVSDWHKYFWRGEITIDLKLYGAGHARHEEFFIFLGRRHLDRFIAKQAAQPDKPEVSLGGRPTDRNRIVAEARRRLDKKENVPRKLIKSPSSCANGSKRNPILN
jgi:hypothetical protein